MKSRFLLLCLLLFILLSCSDDVSKDTISDFASVYTNSDGSAEYFVLDDAKSLYIVKSNTNYKPINQRVFIQYKNLQDDYAGFDEGIELLNYIYDIPTKEIVYIPQSDQQLQDSIGNNAVDLISGIAKGNYLTLRFKYKMSGDKTQLFSMLQDTETIDFGKTIDLQFRHNVLEDKENYMSTDVYICFDIKKYLKNPNQLVFNIAWLDYEDETQHLLVPYRK